MVKSGDAHADCNAGAAVIAAVFNFPLWRASAIAQSGFTLPGSSALERYLYCLRPPYKGMFATIGGMAWARGSIFYGSDKGRQYLTSLNMPTAVCVALPPMVISTLVQCVNQPIIRASVTIQNPASTLPSVTAAIKDIASRKGVRALWHGTSAGVAKTLPKYLVAVVTKYLMDDMLPREGVFGGDQGELRRSFVKAVTAGLAGAILTNPFDVIRNEMFKTDLSLRQTVSKLYGEKGWKFMWRGMRANVIAMAVPISITIFLTDFLISCKVKYLEGKNESDDTRRVPLLLPSSTSSSPHLATVAETIVTDAPSSSSPSSASAVPPSSPTARV